MGRWLLALPFLLLGAPLALAADSTLVLEVAGPGGGTTRTMLEPGSAFAAATIAGAHGPQKMPRFSTQSGDVPAIVRLRGQSAPVPGTRARSRAGLVDEHSRVAAEIARLAGPARRPSTSIRPEYWIAFSGFAVTRPAAALDQLRRHPDVASVDADTEVHASLDVSVPFVGAPDFWATHGGYQGAGQVIAIIDTGVDYTHPDLGGCAAPGGGCRVVGGYDFENGDADPRDDNGHGTHVAAIAAGSGALNGVAPAADILAYKVLNAYGFGFTSSVIAALERSVDPDGDTDPSDHVAVANLSIGGSGTEDDPLALAVDGATESGVVVAVSAGNSGGFFKVESPGVARTAITVGAVSDVGVPASFSSGGPTALDAIKPEIAAPGVGLCAAQAAGTVLGENCLDATHISLNGTSMAAPHVAGAAALLRGIHPALTPADIKSLLVQSARPDSAEIMKVGAGTLSIPAAAALHSVVAPTTVSFGRVDHAPAIWTAGRTITVRNIDTVSRSYAVTPPALAPGITLVATPASFVLAAGATIDVSLDLSVDNAVVPDLPSAPFAYEGAVLITSGGEVQRVPTAVIRTSTLTLHFDEVPTLVVVHDGADVALDLSPVGTTVELLVPPGTYDVTAIFDLNVHPWKIVVHEGIVVTAATTDTMSKLEAANAVDFIPRDELGQALGGGSRTLYLLHRATGFGIEIGGGFGGNPIILSSALSDRYDLRFMSHTTQNGKAYFVMDERSDGIAGDRQIETDPADLTLGRVRYSPRLGEIDIGTLVGVWHVFSPQVSIISFMLNAVASDHDLYVSTTHGVLKDFAAVDIASSLGSHRGPRYRGTDVVGTIEAFSAIEATAPVYRTVTGELPLNMGPAFWFVSFTATGPIMDLEQVGARSNWVFHAQGGDGPEALYGNVQWQLRSGDSTLAGGAMIQSSSGGLFPPNLTLPAPGPYVFDTSDMPYSLGGGSATTRMRASFDTSRADPDPPYLASFELRSQGALTERVALGEDATLTVEPHDASAVMVDATLGVGTTAVPLPVTALGDGRYEVSLMNPCTEPTGRDLTLTVTDAAGNAIHQVFEPAFQCGTTSCSVDAGTFTQRFTLGNFLTGPGDDRLMYRASFASQSVLDPVVSGLGFLVIDGAGQVLADVVVPPGAYDPVTRQGWVRNARGTHATFRTQTPLGGIVRRVRVQQSPIFTALYTVTIAGSRGALDLTPPTLPVTATIFGDASRQGGLCASVHFGSAPAPVACRVERQGALLTCR